MAMADKLVAKETINFIKSHMSDICRFGGIPEARGSASRNIGVFVRRRFGMHSRRISTRQRTFRDTIVAGSQRCSSGGGILFGTSQRARGRAVERFTSSPLRGVAHAISDNAPFNLLTGRRIGPEEATVDSVHHNTSVDGSDRVLIKASVNHAIGARPGGGQLMASATRTMVVEQHHISQSISGELGAFSITKLRFTEGGGE
jgi:hypothetical protein